MFSQIIINNNGISNLSVRLTGQIAICRRLIGADNFYLIEAISAIARYGMPNDRLDKVGLLTLWKDEGISFISKCLVTLWWGRPDYRVSRITYSIDNLARLAVVEDRLYSLYEESNFISFKEGLETLYCDLACNGSLHLSGIGGAFYTKFFHFYFAAHKPKSNPRYLPVIADAIIRKAVFAEMLDRGEDIGDVFSSDASIRSYVRFADRFNYFASDLNIDPFLLEDILFHNAKAVGTTYVAGYNGYLYLPHWIAGRYNEPEQVAIVFNNIMGETYLFEDSTAKLWQLILAYDYCQGFNIDSIRNALGCDYFDLLSFFTELVQQKIIMDHNPSEKEINQIKRTANRKKRSFLKSVKGVGNFHSVFESVDNDYGNRIVEQGIPFAASIELTYACNEACIHCYNPHSPRKGGFGTQKIMPQGELDTNSYIHFLDSLKEIGVAKIVFTGGDPFMKKDLMVILRHAHALKFAISVYTNGQALYSNPNLYDELRSLYPQYIGLSLYSTIPEIHDSITRRKGSCNRTMAIAEKCFHDAIGLQIKCPIMQANMESYGKVFDFALSVNGMPQFDVNITSSIDGDCFATEKLRLTEEQLKVVLKDPRIPLSTENHVGAVERSPSMVFCGAGVSSFNLQPDGTINPCCAFPLKCGNILEQSFDVIWRESPQLLRIRALLYGDSDICGKEKYCKYCNRCIGQSYVEHGKPENHSQDNCFIARIRSILAEKTGPAPSLKKSGLS